jgi:hypothetical protein
MTERDQWIEVSRSSPDESAALVAALPVDDGDSVVLFEPAPEGAQAERRGLFGHKRIVQSPTSASIMKQAGDGPDAGTYVVYLTFPKGARFSERGVAVPDGFALDGDGRDDATLSASLSVPADDVVRFVIEALSVASGGPGREEWRAVLTDTGTTG